MRLAKLTLSVGKKQSFNCQAAFVFPETLVLSNEAITMLNEFVRVRNRLHKRLPRRASKYVAKSRFVAKEGINIINIRCERLLIKFVVVSGPLCTVIV